MKKNKALTAAISVLSLTMVSMCAIGGTFAKYTSQDSATDTAKVAQWGITITANTYHEAFHTATTTQDTKITAAAVGGNAIVAPGSEGKLVGISVAGNPEVNGTIAHDATFSITEASWTVDGQFYCPIEFSNGSTTVKGVEYIDKYDDLVAALNLLDGGSSFNAGASVSDTYTLTWKWAFENGHDDLDTLLGDAEPTFGATISTTVTQVD